MLLVMLMMCVVFVVVLLFVVFGYVLVCDVWNIGMVILLFIVLVVL